jgi:hypothetical protein
MSGLRFRPNEAMTVHRRYSGEREGPSISPSAVAPTGERRSRFMGG